MISPDKLAAGMLPPVESEAPATLVHSVADAGMALAEQLQTTVPEGRYRDAAQSHLVRALQAAYVGLEPVRVPKGAADEPVPYVLAAPQDVEPDPDPAPGEYPDLGLWVLGITTSGMHPYSRLVALVLAQCARPSGYIPTARQPSLADLAARTGLVNLQTVHVYLGDLVAQQWVTRHRIERHGIGRTRYQLRLPNYR